MVQHDVRPTDDGDLLRVLDSAHLTALRWMHGISERDIPASATVDEVEAALGAALPVMGEEPVEVLRHLADAVEPGLMVSQSPRFYGWVMGGTYPVALGADWLTSAWDQNAGLREVTTGVVAAEDIAGRWILELLGLPPESDVGFTTGATMANFTCLAAARTRVLANEGWDVAAQGLTGAPRVRVFVGAERHGSVDLALSLLGLGVPTIIAVDDEGRIRADALADELQRAAGPTIVILQAGNIHSGAFDPFGDAIEAARHAGAWVHIDGAFGLWAAAGPTTRHLLDAAATADSWASDAHKTLNVPYDCGVAIVRDTSALRSTMGMHASYLFATTSDAADPHERVPELSRRARGVPVWATLRSLGVDGVHALVDGLARAASDLSRELSALPGLTVLNDVVFTQVCVACASDEATRALGERLRADGDAFASSSRWHDRDVLRFSVSNALTDAQAVADTVSAVSRALARSDSTLR
ncbi:aspartate aminotransferase family protein [Microbacterium lacus]|uniref:pyridoxal phosphate-dependent decarboxylase family protein n=1 Tax=Microbacterium lacus TaxID=415217 RepID=UPI00384F60F6